MTSSEFFFDTRACSLSAGVLVCATTAFIFLIKVAPLLIAWEIFWWHPKLRAALHWAILDRSLSRSVAPDSCADISQCRVVRRSKMGYIFLNPAPSNIHIDCRMLPPKNQVDKIWTIVDKYKTDISVCRPSSSWNMKVINKKRLWFQSLKNFNH